MATKRMFSKKITDTDLFLDLPLESQALYFHLNMHADDDGFIDSPKKVMRMTGASLDTYKLLLAKRFIITFESGICVIKDWKIHNYIQKDRYQETMYVSEKEQLKEMDPNCIQNGSIGKVSLEEVRVEKTKAKKKAAFNITINHENYKLWKEDFSVFKNYIKEGFTNCTLCDDFMSDLSKRYPKIEVMQTIQKSYKEYWSSERGWAYYQKKKSKKIAFTLLIGNLCSQEWNQVPKVGFERCYK